MLAHAGGADESLGVFLLFCGLWVGWAGWSRLRGKGFFRLPTRAAYVLLALGVALAVSAAVVPRGIFGPTGATQAAPAALRPSSAATIGFSRPLPGEVVHGDTLEVVLTLQGGTVEDTTTTTLTGTTGHIHLSLDGVLVSMTYGLVQQISLQGVARGRHRLQAEFVAADHGPFDPREVAAVSFVRGTS